MRRPWPPLSTRCAVSDAMAAPSCCGDADPWLGLVERVGDAAKGLGARVGVRGEGDASHIVRDVENVHAPRPGCRRVDVSCELATGGEGDAWLAYCGHQFVVAR